MTDQQSTTNTSTVTTPADREIHIERVFDAPHERVFAAFTDPELIPPGQPAVAACGRFWSAW